MIVWTRSTITVLFFSCTVFAGNDVAGTYYSPKTEIAGTPYFEPETLKVFKKDGSYEIHIIYENE